MLQNEANNKRYLLADHFLFGQLDAAEIDNILTLAIQRKFSAGQVIFQKGEEGNSMMILLSGEVKIGAISADGREIVLNIIYPGEVFGEIALLDGKSRSADAIALNDCQLLIIRRRDFLPYIEKHPEVAIQLIGLLCQKLRDTSNTLENIGLLSIPARLARLLLQMAETNRKGDSDSKALRIRLTLSQRQLGNLIGATRESVNKQLRAWQSDGIILQETDSISILRVPDFKMFAEVI